MKIAKSTLIYTIFILLFVSPNSLFSQNGSNNQKEVVLTSLMKARNGEEIFTQLIDNTIDKIPFDKRLSYRKKLEMIAVDVKAEAKQYFLKKYTLAELQAIYNEYKIERRITRSRITQLYAAEWKEYKRKFQKRFREVFDDYTNKVTK